MNFSDAQLQRGYDRNLIERGEASGDGDQGRALMATHDLFQMLEGAHSPRGHEALEHLLSAALGPELGRGYRRAGAGTDGATVELRERRSHLAGERLANENRSDPS